MAIQSFQLDPEAGGVSLAAFDAHTHNYRQLIMMGVDADANWGSAKLASVYDMGLVHPDDDGVDIKAVGVKTTLAPTSTPV